MVVRPGIEIKHPRLVRGINLHPMRPDVAKSFAADSNLYYDIMK
jgi:hypothetical protein